MTSPHPDKAGPAWRNLWSRFAEVAENMDLSPLELIEMRLARLEKRVEAIDTGGDAV